MWTKKQFKDVKHQFSAPMTFDEHAHDESCFERTRTCSIHYCVGGALMRATGTGTIINFPTTHQLEQWLHVVENKSGPVAKDAARRITEYNDVGAFGLAWAEAYGVLVGEE